MRRWNHERLLYFIAMAVTLVAAHLAHGQSRTALLIGCSEFPNFPAASPLPGVANDVPEMHDALVQRFGFDDVKVLSGWSTQPDDVANLPTRANIEAAFDELIAKSTPGSQAFIYLSGHGMPVPVPEGVDLLDPNDPEPDGFDEAFLPADIDSPQDVILDDQFGVWFDALRAKGVHVWAVFDCCHSGMISRGNEPIGKDGTVEKFVDPTKANIAEAEISRAKELAAATSDRTERANVAINSAAPDAGSFVAFYACQPFQSAVERTLPAGAPKDPKNRHSVFSYCLIEALRSPDSIQSYRQLGASVTTRLMGVFGGASRGQTPVIQGDIDASVFGDPKWPDASPIVLHARDGELSVSPGTLADVHVGTTLAVQGADDASSYVKAISATPTKAEVVPCDGNGDPLDEPPAYSDGSLCRVFRRAISQRPLRIAVRNLVGGSDVDLTRLVEEIRTASGTETVTFHSETEQADWIVAHVDAATAKERYGLAVTQPSVVLAPATLSIDAAGKAKNVIARPFEGSPNLANEIATDLRRVRAWTALWELAVAYPEGANAKQKVSLKVEFPQGNETVAAPAVEGGDRIVATVTNSDFANSYYYALLFLTDTYGIRQVADGSLPARPNVGESRYVIDRMRVDERFEGAQAYLLVAVSHKEKYPLDLRFLQQFPLGVRHESGDDARPRGSVATLLGRLSGEANRDAAASPIVPPQTSAVVWTVRPRR